MSRKKQSRFRVDPMLDELVDHLFSVRESFREEESDYPREFDFPDYGGLPKRISNRLSSETVDRIQDYIGSLAHLRSKKRFTEELVPLVVEDFVD